MSMQLFQSRDLRAVGILILLWMLFFWRILTPVLEDKASFKQGDFSGQFVAFGAYQYERMSQGEIPLWNPYNNGGLPFIADTQAAVFYPPRLITIALAKLSGGWSYHALELEAIAHVLAYSLLMYLFIRRLTDSVYGAFAGAIIASYGGYISGYPPLQLALLEAAIWLPVGAWCLLEATRSEKIQWTWIVFAGFVSGLSWMAGHPQTSWFSTYVLVAWLAYRVHEKQQGWVAFFGGTALMGIITLGTTAVTFLPGIEYLTMTVRSELGFDAKGNGFPYQDVIQFLFPGSVSAFSPLYLGIPALVFVFIACWYQWKQSRFWLSVALFGLLLSFGANSALYHLLYNPLPGLRFFRGQERAAFLVANSLAILAGIGMSQLETRSINRDSNALLRFMNGLILIIGGMTALIYAGWWGNVGNGFGQLISPAALSTMVIVFTWAFVMWTVQHSDNKWSKLLLMTVIVFELFSVNMDAETNYDSVPSSEQLSITAPEIVQAMIDVVPDVPFRVDGFRGLEANYGSLYQVMDIRGISPLFLGSTWNIIYRDYVNNPRAWEIFAVRYVFSERDSFGQVETTIITEGNDRNGHVFLHEINNPRPFAHLSYNVAVVGSDSHAVELLFDPNFPVRDTVILQMEPSLSLPDSAPENASATVINFEAESITVEIDTSENAILSLSLVDYPGWQATLDGNAVEILRAYGSLSAIEVPAGDHTLELRFKPLSYRIGAIMSGITWIFVSITLIFALIPGMRRETHEAN